MQLEMLNKRYNIIFHCLFPIALYSVLYISVVAAVGILRMEWKLLPHISPTLGYSILAGLFLPAVFVGYSNYRIGETLVTESSESLRAFQLQVEAAMLKELKGLEPSARATMKRFSRRMFRRRPLGIQLWFFMTVEDGMALEFLQSVLENIVTGILMINVNVPMVLL